MKDMMLLIQPLIPALRRYAYAMVRDRSAADDLVQDCLEKAVGHWPQRRVDGNAQAWIYAILHNLAINFLRRKKRQGASVPLDDVKGFALSRSADQEDNLQYRDLLSALDKLPEDHRSVILLVAVEDFSYAETAKILDIPVGTVMSRLSRARAQLRRNLEDVEQAPPKGSHLRRIK
jgi:RNA polymerase sigma-70 factor (ECF subfamily)